MRIIGCLVQKGLFSGFFCGFLNLVIFISYKYGKCKGIEQWQKYLSFCEFFKISLRVLHFSFSYKSS